MSSSRYINHNDITPAYHAWGCSPRASSQKCNWVNLNAQEIQDAFPAKLRGSADSSGKINLSSPDPLSYDDTAYSAILTFLFFFLDFSPGVWGTSEVVPLSPPRTWDPSADLPDTFECPKLLSSFLFWLCLCAGSALCWPSDSAEPWLLRFFDPLENRDLVFFEEPGRPDKFRSVTATTVYQSVLFMIEKDKTLQLLAGNLINWKCIP